jgi:membrane protease YdiL (CAAX protease family)
MAKRPAKGRASGGRVTPSARSSSSRPERSSGRARVLQADRPKPARTATRARTEPDEAGDAPSSPPPGILRRIFDPQGTLSLPPAERPRPWWGLGDVLAWFLIGQTLAVLLRMYVAVQGGYALDRPAGPGARTGEIAGKVMTGAPAEVTRTVADMPLWLTQGVVLLPLWAALIGGSLFTVHRKGFGPVKDLRLAFQRIDLPVGIAVGLACQLVLNPIVYRLLFVFTGEQDVSAGARSITDLATSPALLVLLFVTVGFIAPVAEELFFRGLALQSFVKRFGRVGGLLLSAVLFALVHGNPLYMFALLPFAVVLGWLVLRFDRLGPALVAHVAYNIVTATLLVTGIELPW